METIEGENYKLLTDRIKDTFNIYDKEGKGSIIVEY